MKIKTRLYLLKRKTRRFFTYEIRKAFAYSVYSLALSIAILGFINLGYVVGRTDTINKFANKHETDIPMCAIKKTEIRENPTGFILSDIKRGDVVWVVQLQVPFAVVWYSDNHNWYLGTITASILAPCEFILREEL